MYPVKSDSTTVCSWRRRERTSDAWTSGRLSSRLCTCWDIRTVCWFLPHGFYAFYTRLSSHLTALRPRPTPDRRPKRQAIHCHLLLSIVKCPNPIRRCLSRRSAQKYPHTPENSPVPSFPQSAATHACCCLHRKFIDKEVHRQTKWRTYWTQVFISLSHVGIAIRYDTIRDAILTCARKPTQIGLIYRTIRIAQLKLHLAYCCLKTFWLYTK